MLRSQSTVLGSLGGRWRVCVSSRHLTTLRVSAGALASLHLGLQASLVGTQRVPLSSPSQLVTTHAMHVKQGLTGFGERRFSYNTTR
jgi:hypothetical protein